MGSAVLSDHEFTQFQRFIFDAAGITLAPSKKALVSGRLSKRLLHFQMRSYGEYFELIRSGKIPGEAQNAIDLLTTNETYFFRENKHFDLLRQLATAARDERSPFRVWSAACSTGEEPYSIAMILADVLEGRPWDLFGSDISQRVLSHARRGHYVLERTTHVPPHYLQRFCLRGIAEQHGTLLIERSLRQRVQFMQVNLNGNGLPDLGQFDVIFLRNVLIYFSPETKRHVVSQVLKHLRPGGHLFIGHSESLHDMSDGIVPIAPSMYRKP